MILFCVSVRRLRYVCHTNLCFVSYWKKKSMTRKSLAKTMPYKWQNSVTFFFFPVELSLSQHQKNILKAKLATPTTQQIYKRDHLWDNSPGQSHSGVLYREIKQIATSKVPPNFPLSKELFIVVSEEIAFRRELTVGCQNECETLVWKSWLIHILLLQWHPEQQQTETSIIKGFPLDGF